MLHKTFVLGVTLHPPFLSTLLDESSKRVVKISGCTGRFSLGLLEGMQWPFAILVRSGDNVFVCGGLKVAISSKHKALGRVLIAYICNGILRISFLEEVCLVIQIDTMHEIKRVACTVYLVITQLDN